MKRNLTAICVFPLLAFAFSVSAVAQSVVSGNLEQMPSIQRQVSTDLPAKSLSVNFGVSRVQDNGVQVEVSIFAGKDVTSLSPLDIAVQPLAVEKGPKGETALTDVGNSSTISSGPRTSLSPTSEGLVARPSLTMRVPTNATAVRVTVKGLGKDGQNMTVYLPIKDTPSIATLTTQAR